MSGRKAQRQAASLTRAGPARTRVLIHRTHVDCLTLKVSSSSRHECTCQVGGAEESDAGSVREEVRSELANVVLPGQRLRRCGSSSVETGDEDCGKRETADRCTGHHRLWSDNGSGPRACNISLVSRTEGGALETVRGLKGSQAWSNGEDWPPCTTHWAAGRQFRRQQANPFPRQKLLSWKTCLTLFKHEKTLEQRHQERRDKLPKDMRPAMLLAKGVDSTATPVPGLPTSACAYCDSYQQPCSWPCSDGCGKLEQ